MQIVRLRGKSEKAVGGGRRHKKEIEVKREAGIYLITKLNTLFAYTMDKNDSINRMNEGWLRKLKADFCKLSFKRARVWSQFFNKMQQR